MKKAVRKSARFCTKSWSSAEVALSYAFVMSVFWGMMFTNMFMHTLNRLSKWVLCSTPTVSAATCTTANYTLRMASRQYSSDPVELLA